MQTILRSGLLFLGLALAGPTLAQVPAPANNATAPLPGANSFAEPQARKLIESRGFSDVSPLVNDSQGVWRGTARNGTVKVRISVDYKGNVSANPE